jgi:endonuclease-3
MNKKQIKSIIEILKAEYPSAKCELNFTNPFELLIATVLSAQCTDIRVNKVTKELFEKCKTPEDFAIIDTEELQNIIKPCGIYKQKAKNIKNLSKIIVEKYKGQVPNGFDDLVKLPGVGRKTANVVLCNAYKIPAFAVDTHVFRVSNRIGLANATDVLGTENDLMKNINKEDWCFVHHLIISHGRNVCRARKPLCNECPIKDYCKYFKAKE